MPLPEGTRYRWKTNPDGTKVRLAFRGNQVIEVKKKGGKAHMVEHAAQKKALREMED